MQMSVAIGPYGSYDPVETPKPLWGSPGAELSTWTTFQFCCETAIHGHALRHGPPELYSYTSLYSAINYTAIQYIAIHHTQPLQHPSAVGAAFLKGGAAAHAGAMMRSHLGALVHAFV